VLTNITGVAMGAAGTLDTRPGESTAKEKKIAGLRQ